MPVKVFLYVLLGLALFTLLRYGIFLLSNALAGRLGFIRKEAGGLGPAVARGVVTAMAADVVALPSTLLLALPERRPSGNGIPVVLVHGLYHNRTAWLVFAHRLRRAGFENVHTYGYNSFTKDFGYALAGLKAKLGRILGDDPESRVMLIGHSLGGLLCRCAAGDPRFRDRVTALVALGSPHGGSELAWLGGNRMARGLIPGRAISEAVADAPDPGCPKLALYTLADDYVIPLDLLRTGRPDWDERVCAPMGHVWMLYSRGVAASVIEFLRLARDKARLKKRAS
ncbi:alpha/beta fold hydrolase [Pseudodesulfovibrio thermohalotolerans]|uniref:esterase/lipase family protein n=1 Tax=Pseudodesulfovibrio thermohalotolerans TaxID=2880651 RepID=UPI002443274F|nr:alpha/beta fold hydrolase [Pseudodesulfovibrio thermohalotolerans]WFS62109.1 alpha/beta fold hydrolase [Pseudodesulfovibrio thermohalotolerans]